MRVHDIEVTIANRYGTSFGFAESYKDKAKFKRNVEFFENSTKEPMSVFKAEPIRIMGKAKTKEKRSTPFKDATKRRPTLKEL